MSMGNASLYQPSQPNTTTPAPSTQPNTVFPTVSNIGAGSSTTPTMSGGSGSGISSLIPGIGSGVGQAAQMPQKNNLGQLVQGAIGNPGMLQGLK